MYVCMYVRECIHPPEMYVRARVYKYLCVAPPVSFLFIAPPQFWYQALPLLYIYMCVSVRAHIHIYVVCLHMRACVCMCVRACVYTDMCVYVSVGACVRACLRVCIYIIIIE